MSILKKADGEAILTTLGFTKCDIELVNIWTKDIGGGVIVEVLERSNLWTQAKRPITNAWAQSTIPQSEELFTQRLADLGVDTSPLNT